jgi:hypothetical protein
MDNKKITALTVTEKLLLTDLEFVDLPHKVTTKTKVTAICEKCGGNFNAMAWTILKGQRCCSCNKGKPGLNTPEKIKEAAIAKGFVVVDFSRHLKADDRIRLICRCGVEFSPEVYRLVHGYVKSCGCLPRDGKVKTSTYTYEDLYDIAASGGCKVQDSSRTGPISGVHQKIEVICSCGDKFYPKINGFLSGIWRSCGCEASKAETKIYDYIRSLGVEAYSRSRKIIPPLEVDIWVPDRKIAIEYDGLYWHSEKALGADAKTRIKTKADKIASTGGRLIVIFEDEWLQSEEKVKARLRSILGQNEVSIGARKCEVVEISPEKAREVVGNWHLQKSRPGIHIGLSYVGNLVAIATFARGNPSRGIKPNEWELSRFCSKPNHSIPGGLSRILKAFKAKTGATEVFSYSDNRWSRGDVYAASGFVEVSRSPQSYHYVKSQKRYHRFTLRKDILLKRFGGDPNKTERELAIAAGYSRIWDLGTTKWKISI